MCGIVAMLSASGQVASEALARATSALHHRGPDGRGVWIAPHGRVGLGHTRLSIIDLLSGEQPIANEDESVHIVVNGEFYDHERIQRELESRGHRLRTRSDSEIALHLYEELGEGCLRELRGEFALALWDERRQRLFVARDRFGIKPLFYARIGDALYVASEAKALFAAGVPARWDRESVYQDLVALTDAGRTLFDGIYQVPPGHYLLASTERVEVVRYWDLHYPTADRGARSGTETEHVDRLRAALREAVRLRLRADVPVGVYLSGGLDSCALLGMASMLRKAPFEAFTIGFDDPSGAFDESPIAEEMAKRVGASCHVFRMSEALLADHFAEAVGHAETTVTNLHAVAKYLLARKVRDLGFKVVLTGEGADELLAGYPMFRADAVVHSTNDAPMKRAQLAQVRAGDQRYGAFGQATGAGLPMESVQQALGFVPTFLRSRAIGGAHAHALLSPSFVAEFANVDPYEKFLDAIGARDAPPADALNQTMRIFLRSYFPNKILSYLGDRSEMSHSIEGRVPFLDHPLAELVADMPVSMKVKEGAGKHVLREAAKPFVTETVYARPKHMFLAPLQARSRMRELAFDILTPARMASLSFFEPSAVKHFLEDEPPVEDVERRSRYFTVMISLASVCVLGERYGLTA